MFLDSDARLTEGALATLVDAVERDPRTGLAGPRLTYPDGRLQLSARRYPPLALPVLRFPGLRRYFEGRPTIRRHLMADEEPRRRPVAYVLGACQLFRAEAQEAVGEIDERIWFGHDDADWCFRVRRAGYDVLYVPEARVIHDYRRTTAAHPFSRHTLRVLVAHVHFQRKWWRARRELDEAGDGVPARSPVGVGRAAVGRPAR
jgi:GT2 family glycosyltransferase